MFYSNLLNRRLQKVNKLNLGVYYNICFFGTIYAILLIFQSLLINHKYINEQNLY